MAEVEDEKKQQIKSSGIVVPNPKPNKGFASKVVDLIENLIVKLMYDPSQPHHYLAGNFAPFLDETPPTNNLHVLGSLLRFAPLPHTPLPALIGMAAKSSSFIDCEVTSMDYAYTGRLIFCGDATLLPGGVADRAHEELVLLDMGGYATKMKGMRALIRWSLRSCVVQRRSWTLEAWTTSGEFRSLAYMRPLAIWSMHWALSKPTLFNQKTKLEADEGSLHRHKVGFAKVAQLLKLPQEEESRSILQVVFDYTCKRLWI